MEQTLKIFLCLQIKELSISTVLKILMASCADFVIVVSLPGAGFGV